MTATERLDEYLNAYQKYGVSARALCRVNGLHERFLYGMTEGSSIRQWRIAVAALGVNFQIFFSDNDPEKIVAEIIDEDQL